MTYFPPSDSEDRSPAALRLREIETVLLPDASREVEELERALEAAVLHRLQLHKEQRQLQETIAIALTSRVMAAQEKNLASLLDHADDVVRGEEVRLSQLSALRSQLNDIATAENFYASSPDEPLPRESGGDGGGSASSLRDASHHSPHSLTSNANLASSSGSAALAAQLGHRSLSSSLLVRRRSVSQPEPSVEHPPQPLPQTRPVGAGGGSRSHRSIPPLDEPGSSSSVSDIVAAEDVSVHDYSGSVEEEEEVPLWKGSTLPPPLQQQSQPLPIAESDEEDEAKDNEALYQHLYSQYSQYLRQGTTGYFRLWLVTTRRQQHQSEVNAEDESEEATQLLRPWELSLLLSREKVEVVELHVEESRTVSELSLAVSKEEVAAFTSQLLSRLPRLEYLSVLHSPVCPLNWDLLDEVEDPFPSLKVLNLRWSRVRAADLVKAVGVFPRLVVGGLRATNAMVNYGSYQNVATVTKECRKRVMIF